MKRIACLTALSIALVAALAPSADAASYVTIEKGDGGQYHVEFGGKLFATVHTEEFHKPIIYPIIGPHGVRMTRDYPMKQGTEGEAKDHPHHQSLWYTHGNVNGVDFWALGKGKIVPTKVATKDSGADASISLHNKWVNAGDDSIVCTDTQKITFHKYYAIGDVEYAMIDYEITIHASEGDVVFGDTKEGSMGIRTHPALRITNGAKALNSEGVEGQPIWGKRAKWVSYSNKVGDHVVGVSIFDHPSNPRHPTWWHARQYGLVAANPFGIHDFERQGKGAGDFKIEKGKSVTFKYRFVFHGGDAEAVKIGERYDEWAK